MSELVVLWAGPVNLSQVGAARLPGSVELNLTCTGDGSPSCGAIADGFLDGDGRRLPALLASRGADPTSEVVVAAFSAGGSVVKRIALDARDRAQVRAMMLADATYTTSGADEGFVLYVLDAVDGAGGGRLFVSTASSAPNKTHPSGIETQRIVRTEVERRLGRSFEELDPESLGISPPPAAAWALGDAYFLEYPDVAHGAQVTMLAERVWDATLIPWLEGGFRPGSGGSRLLAAGLLLVGLVAVWKGTRA